MWFRKDDEILPESAGQDNILDWVQMSISAFGKGKTRQPLKHHSLEVSSQCLKYSPRCLTVDDVEKVVLLLRLVIETQLQVQHLSLGGEEGSETSLGQVGHVEVRHPNTLSLSAVVI